MNIMADYRFYSGFDPILEKYAFFELKNGWAFSKSSSFVVSESEYFKRFNRND